MSNGIGQKVFKEPITSQDKQVDKIANGLHHIAESLESVATALQRLGNNDAFTGMGAIENLSLEVKTGLGMLADAVGMCIPPKK
jgi:hypothetical protein